MKFLFARDEQEATLKHYFEGGSAPTLNVSVVRSRRASVESAALGCTSLATFVEFERNARCDGVYAYPTRMQGLSVLCSNR